MKKLMMSAAAALALAACSPESGGDASVAWSGPPLPVHELTIEIDDDALALLKRNEDRIRVTTFYYGLPTKASAAKANRRHELEMGMSMVMLDAGAKSLRIQGQGLNAALLPDTADGEVHYKASIHAMSKRNIIDDVLECSIARGVLTQPQPAPRVIRCGVKRP